MAGVGHNFGHSCVTVYNSLLGGQHLILSISLSLAIADFYSYLAHTSFTAIHKLLILH